MASKSCTLCLRTLRSQSRSLAQCRSSTQLSPSLRSFSITSQRSVEIPAPNATPATSIPAVTPTRTEGGAKSSTTPASLKAALEFKKVAGKSAETYTAYGATEVLYKECARQASYTINRAQDEDAEPPKTEDGEDLGVGEGWWHTELGLKPTFSTWSQVTMLHMYLLSARFRAFEPYASMPWQQHLLDHFFYDAENRMTINHNMHARGTRNKYLKDMFIQWRGLLAAYDEGLAKGDAVLAAAVWRNVFKANEDVDVRALAQIVSYMRRILKGLDALPDEKVQQAAMQFGSPKDEAAIVSARSSMMDLPFEKAPSKDLPTPKKA